MNTRAQTRGHTHTQAQEAGECVCCGLVGVNLQVNEMALSVSNSKRVRAKELCAKYGGPSPPD